MTISEFRVALTTDDFERATAFYRDGLGLEPGALWTDGARGKCFLRDAPRWKSLTPTMPPR